MCWTRFFPCTIKVSDQTGWPRSSAQWQVGLPQRRWVRESEPGRASAGIEKRRSSWNLRWRSREAIGPWPGWIILLYIYTKNRHKSSGLCECENRSLLKEDRQVGQKSDLTGADWVSGCQSSETAAMMDGCAGCPNRRGAP